MMLVCAVIFFIFLVILAKYNMFGRTQVEKFDVFKSFKKVPTLKSYPLIGHSYLFFPRSKYEIGRLTEAFIDISKTLGSIFKLKLGGAYMVITLDPNHTRILYQNEGKYPGRPSFPALTHFRKREFNSVGIVPSNGKEWYELRKGLTPLLKPSLIAAHKQRLEEVADTFIDYVKLYQDKNFILLDLYSHLLKFTVEAISVISPGRRFHCLFNDDAEASEIVQASIEFMEGLYATLVEPPLWKFWKTGGCKKLESSHNTIYRILRQRIDELKVQFVENPDCVQETQPYMYSLFKNEQLSWDDKLMLSMEVFLGGIDATATTLAFTLYYLSHNIEVQEVARKSIVTGTQFLKACIKETLRLAPTAGGNARFSANDTVMDEYFIPKGTLILSLNAAMSQNENYFHQATEYRPERFIKETEDFHKFATLPFGYGPRMCPGKKVAENEIIILLTKILQNFHLEAISQPGIGLIHRMNRIPERPIDIKFINTNQCYT